MPVVISGTNGVTFPDSSLQAAAASPFGLKNRIINGAMAVDQRNAGASQTFTAAGALAYAVDRWYGFCTGANVTGARVAGSTTPTNSQYRYRFTGAASVTAVGFGQRIEQSNSYDLAGSTCTLSADLGISATLTTVTWTASYATTTADTFGTLASPTVTQIATGTFTVSATMTNFNAQISVPAAATTGIQIVFTVGALTAGLTWTIGNVQLERNSTATLFEQRLFNQELANCQRYYQTYTQPPLRGVVGGATSANRMAMILPVVMRASPTAVVGALPIFDGANTTNVTSVGVAYLSTTQAEFDLNVGGGMTTGRAIVVYQSGSTSMTLTAEL
jgi:hypothetical protein